MSDTKQAVSDVLRSTSRSLRVIQTIASVRMDHGGTSRSVPALCDSLVESGVDNFLVTTLPSDSTIESNLPQDTRRVRVTSGSRLWRPMAAARHFLSSLRELTYDRACSVVIHDHALWLPSNRCVAGFCRSARIKRIVSPRGMLSPWAMNYGRWKKTVAWMAYQRNDLLSADAFHATSKMEADDIRRLGFEQPIAVIPNGIDTKSALPIALRLKRPKSRVRTALFLSRIHPKKGLLELVKAWDRARPRNWRLIVGGPDEGGYRRVVENQVASLGLGSVVSFTGEISNQKKWEWYHDADLFILPSFSENFGIVVAEAMIAGLPVIATTGTPWRVLPEIGAGWCVEPEVLALEAALRDACELEDNERVLKGQIAAEYAAQAFGWDAISRRMAEFYDWLLFGGDTPSCVWV